MVDGALSPFSDMAILLLRLFVGVIFIVHGWAKVDPRARWGHVGLGEDSWPDGDPRRSPL